MYPLTIAYLLDILSFLGFLTSQTDKSTRNYSINLFTSNPTPDFTPESPPPPLRTTSFNPLLICF
jgi:hypothetical protein